MCKLLAMALAFLTMVPAMRAGAQPAAAQADFLFVGTYHMNNPGRDVHNTRADDVLAAGRQREIAEVARLIERYRPTKVMVEVETRKQQELDERFAASCKGKRPLSRDESEQLGFRIACDLDLDTVHAVDWNDLGPIRDEASIDYLKAVERHHQQAQYAALLAAGKAESEESQRVLDHGSVLDMLRRLNSSAWLAQNAQSYYGIGLLGTPSDPAGANWVQYWFGRNLTIFNTVARLTEPGDRILVIYGAGHGNYLRQLAGDSGVYRVHDPLRWLSAQGGP